MQQIEKDVYITNAYPGVTLGAIFLEQGTVLVDSPLHPEDGRAWQTSLRNLGGGVERMLVCLDDHFDRTIGIRLLDTVVLTHLETAEILNNRPAIFKGHGPETGSDWESCDGLSGIRWARPSLTFSEAAYLNWSEEKILFEYHPGPAPGAIWLVLPETKVVFVGDAVVVDQPPFLAAANIPLWIETLDVLLSPAYKNYLVVSSRGGLISTDVIREQRRYLRDIHKRLERLAERQAEPEATENMIPSLLSHLKFHQEFQMQYTQRLRHGLCAYYLRHYAPPDLESEE